MVAAPKDSPSNTQVFNKFLSDNARTLGMLDTKSYDDFITKAREVIIETGMRNERFSPLEFAQQYPATKGFDAFRKPRTSTTAKDTNAVTPLQQSYLQR